MTPKAHSSPKPLILYPYLHRNSQCCSCHTVMPGDICFNCGRLSTLLVTPRPPRNSLQKSIKVQQPEPVVLSQNNSPVPESKAFDSQYALVETLLAKREEERVSKAHLERAFDTQLEEIEDLLDAGKKFANLCNVAAEDVAIFTGKRPSGTSSRRPLTPSPLGTDYKSSTTHSTKLSSSSKSSNTLRPDPFAENGPSYRENTARWIDAVSPAATSPAPFPPAHHHESFNTHSTSLSGSSKSSHTIQPDTFAAEDGFSEDGRPYRENMSRWMEDVRPAVNSSATLSRRGVECRLRMPGKFLFLSSGGLLALKAKVGARRETGDDTSTTNFHITTSDSDNGTSHSMACSSTSWYGALKLVGATSEMFSDGYKATDDSVSRSESASFLALLNSVNKNPYRVSCMS